MAFLNGPLQFDSQPNLTFINSLIFEAEILSWKFTFAWICSSQFTQMSTDS